MRCAYCMARQQRQQNARQTWHNIGDARIIRGCAAAATRRVSRFSRIARMAASNARRSMARQHRAAKRRIGASNMASLRHTALDWTVIAHPHATPAPHTHVPHTQQTGTFPTPAPHAPYPTTCLPSTTFTLPCLTCHTPPYHACLHFLFTTTSIYIPMPSVLLVVPTSNLGKQQRRRQRRYKSWMVG